MNRRGMCTLKLEKVAETSSSCVGGNGTGMGSVGEEGEEDTALLPTSSEGKVRLPVEYLIPHSDLFRLLSEDGTIDATNEAATCADGGGGETEDEDQSNCLVIPSTCSTSAVALQLFAEFVLIRRERDVPPPPRPLPVLADEREAKAGDTVCAFSSPDDLFALEDERKFFQEKVLLGQGMKQEHWLVELLTLCDFLQYRPLLVLGAAYIAFHIHTASLADMATWSRCGSGLVTEQELRRLKLLRQRLAEDDEQDQQAAV